MRHYKFHDIGQFRNVIQSIKRYVAFDGKDEDGDQVANGVYLYKVIIKKGNETRNVTEKLARLR